MANQDDFAEVALQAAEMRLTALAQERDRLLSETQQLRSQIDGWRLYTQLRKDQLEIDKLLDDVLLANVRAKCGHEIYSGLLRVKVKLAEIREREI
jgi:hypothetical protein